MRQFIQEKILPVVMKFVNSNSVVAVKEGFVATMALTIVGSIFLLLARFPYMPIQQFLADVSITPILMQAYNATFNFLAPVAVFSIGYYYAKNKGIEPLASGILSLVAYVLLIEYQAPIPDSKQFVKGVISFDYLGTKGMIAAIIIGLIVGKIYSFFIERKITIKMPDSVPEGVANSFSAIIPGAVVITLASVFYAIFKINNTTFIDFIYKMIQVPLQGMTSSLPGAILMAFAISFLWWFGIHGASIVAGIMGGILTANMNANQAIIEAGQTLTSANGHIVTYNFRSLLLIMTGSGITIGLVIFMTFFAKSKQFKALGKLSIGSSIFNINEPILFGTPIVLNPLLLIPFILVPVLTAIVSYVSMDLGLVPLMGSINPPWTTPPIISGFITGGLGLALLQLVIILISFIVYYPFIKKQDDINYEQEQKEGVKNEVNS